jgi:hypothetical protein
VERVRLVWAKTPMIDSNFIGRIFLGLKPHMKEVLLQFPTLKEMVEYIKIVDVSSCSVSYNFFSVLGELSFEDIELAKQSFKASIFDLSH